MSLPEFAAIIPAAGFGSRSGHKLPKQYVEIAGSTVLAHTLRPFASMAECLEIVLVIDDAWRDMAMKCAEGIDRVRFVAGGPQRQNSIALGLDTLAADVKYVLIHDAARPCITRVLIDRVATAAALHGAAIPTTPVHDTMKRIDEHGRILETIPRHEIRAVQTPQGFDRALLIRAHSAALLDGYIGTDDSSLVERIGAVVQSVEGDPFNIKITTPEDFDRAERTLNFMRAVD